MNNKIKIELISWFRTICVSMILAIGITLFIKPTVVSGESMYPTLNDKECLIVNRLSYLNDAPKRGDIIVFKTDLIDHKTNKYKNLVKRVIALPGEHVVIKNSEVFINDEKLSESYLHRVYTNGEVDMIVPQNHIFTMGDNRPRSEDSRQIGVINLNDVIGKISIRLYPINKVGTVE